MRVRAGPLRHLFVRRRLHLEEEEGAREQRTREELQHRALAHEDGEAEEVPTAWLEIYLT